MDKILLNLEKILEQRKTASSDKSYVASLYNEGTNKILEKISEESEDVGVFISEGIVTLFNGSMFVNTGITLIISKFKKITGCPIVINTSFNIRGEPIVCTPEDAFRCFMGTELDMLVKAHKILLKKL